MVMTDPIADMIIRIKNASSVYHEEADIPSSSIKKKIAQILKDEGFVTDFKIVNKNNKEFIKVFLRYGSGKERFISDVKRISKPGVRRYVSKDKIPKVFGGAGIAIISTSKGVMTDKETRSLQLGGEVICYIW